MSFYFNSADGAEKNQHKFDNRSQTLGLCDYAGEAGREFAGDDGRELAAVFAEPLEASDAQSPSQTTPWRSDCSSLSASFTV